MTIYDIAKQAGVSASTVSRVINGKPGISEATRRKVQKLLDENNYIPDVTARGLVTQSSRTVGILIEDIRISLHTDAVYTIEQEMMEQGYTCITLSTGPTLEKKLEFIRILEQRRVEGAIFIGSMFGEEKGQTDSPIRQEVASHLGKIPVVLINGDLEIPNVYSIMADEERGTEEGYAHLVEEGRKEIIYLTEVATPSNKMKVKGYRSGCLKYGGGQEGKVYQAPGRDTNPVDAVEKGRKAAKEILRRFPGMDAVMCSTDMTAIGCIRGLIEAGKRVPEDVAVMGVDNSLFGRLLEPTLTTIDNKLEECARNAARILLEAIDGRDPSRRIIVPTELIRRESTAQSIASRGLETTGDHQFH